MSFQNFPNKSFPFITAAVVFFLLSCAPNAILKKETVDLIVHNAVVYTVDPNFTVAESFAVKNGRIVEVGKNDSILLKYESPNMLDAKGKAVYPGFIDAHCHFYSYGKGLNQVDLVGTKSFDEVIQRVQNFVKSHPVASGQWIMGRGWDQNDWAVKEYPDRKWLDSLFPSTPVFLTRIDGHAALANSEALKKAGINSGTKISGGAIGFNFIPGGEELWTPSNELEEIKHLKYPLWVPTGILIDNAVDMVTKVIPVPTKEEIKTALLAAQKNCFAVGLTTVDDAGLEKQVIDIMDEMQKNAELKMRVYAMLTDNKENLVYYLQHNTYKTERLNVRSFKFYGDGALGSRGACLIRPYDDKAGQYGFLLSKPEYYKEMALKMLEQGFQMNTHAIGDSANRFIASVYNYTLIFPRKEAKGKDTLITVRSNDPGAKHWRWRIEHCQVVDDADLALFKKCGIIPSVQPTHATSDMYWAKDRLGEARVKNAYAYRALLSAYGMLALGTDFPVENINPMYTFYAAVARKDLKGFSQGGFQMENALTREETLKGMTTWVAYANFEENEKGRIEKGMFADFVILENDIMKINIDQVPSVKVVCTFVNGEKVFETVP